MIEKMEFISITGPKADIDRVVNQYLSKYEIHLENALAQLKTVSESYALSGDQPLQKSSGESLNLRVCDPDAPQKDVSLSLEESVSLIQKFDAELTELGKTRKDLEEQQKNLEGLLGKTQTLPSIRF